MQGEMQYCYLLLHKIKYKVFQSLPHRKKMYYQWFEFYRAQGQTFKMVNPKGSQIIETGWLNDKHMSAGNEILKLDYPFADGLQDTELQQNYSWKQPTSQYVQFLHMNNNHWIIITNVSGLSASPSTVFVYDSLHQNLSEETKLLISKFHQGKKIHISVMNV